MGVSAWWGGDRDYDGGALDPVVETNTMRYHLTWVYVVEQKLKRNVEFHCRQIDKNRQKSSKIDKNRQKSDNECKRCSCEYFWFDHTGDDDDIVGSGSGSKLKSRPRRLRGNY